METTILLSKVFGVYLVVGGLAYVIRRKYFMSILHELVEDKGLRLITASAELAAGLFLIFTHNIWNDAVTGIVSLIGWLLALEGAMYLFISDKMLRRLFKAFNNKAWFFGAGLASIAAGAYLVGYGFNLGLFFRLL